MEQRLQASCSKKSNGKTTQTFPPLGATILQTPTPAHRFSSRSTYASNEPDTSLRVGWKIGQSKCRRATIGRCGVCAATVELATSSAQIKTSGKRKRLEAFVLRWHDLINRSPSKNTSAAWLRISARLSLRPVQRVGPEAPRLMCPKILNF